MKAQSHRLETPDRHRDWCRRTIDAVMVAAFFICASVFQSIRGQDLQSNSPLDTAGLQWPRYYTTNGYDFAIYQPQISSWPGNQLNGRFVVAVRPSGTTNESYGVVFFQAQTDIDKVNRLVTLDDFQITRLTFPTQPAMETQYRSILLSIRGQGVKVIPLDHLEAVLAASSEAVKAKAQEVKNDPPQIFYSAVPALLVLVDGPPVMAGVTGNYQRVINTRAALFLDNDPSVQSYFLFADRHWFTATMLTGPWSLTANPPPGLDTALTAALVAKEVDPLYPRDPTAPAASQVFVSTVPAELLETDGNPSLLSVAGTDLLYVSNTASAIFYYPDDGNYYVLISGRWFKGPNFQGPWTFVPAGQLPGDFAKIPADSDKSNVLLSVPGTPQAQEAVVANSIPQTAAIQRDQAQIQVAYSGAPSFMPIAGTTLSYAVNTETPVIMVAPDSYYACQGGVWFQSLNATGAWDVATSVPSVIYTIPTSCPINYVTYAYIYGYTSTTVYVGYTPGYMGTIVAPGGVVVYGTGYYYQPTIIGGSYVAYPPTYGYGASFALGAAVGFSFGYCAASSSTCGCEPYWGCYSWAANSGYGYAHCNVNACNFYTHWGAAVHSSGYYGYNAYTGNEWAGRSAATFNPYTGTRGTAGSAAAYNPYTGNAAAVRGGSWYNPYSGASASATSSANANRTTGNYSGSRQASGYNPANGNYASGSASVSGNFHNGTESVNRSGTAGNTTTGNSVSWNNGSMTADRDGNIYSYNQSTGAQRYNAGTSSWQSANSDDYNRQVAAQSVGGQRFNNWSSGGGGGWSGYHGGGWRR